MDTHDNAFIRIITQTSPVIIIISNNPFPPVLLQGNEKKTWVENPIQNEISAKIFVLIIVRVIFQNPTNSRKFEMEIIEEITRIFVRKHGEETK
jgi:hypothetical protein